MVRTVTLVALLWVGMAGWAFSQNYYYGPEGKTFLEVSMEKILIEFQPDVDFETRQSLLANFPQLAPLQREMLIPAPVRTLAEVQGVQTEEELRQLLQEIKALDAVLHAGAFLAHKDGTLHGIDRSLLVRLQQPGDQALLQNWARQHGAAVEQANEFDPQLFHLRVGPDAPVNALQLANILYESGLFDYAEPDFLRLMERMSTNDPFVGNQWALNNDGNNTSTWGGTAGSDMNVFNAWNTSTGSSGIKVAILDEGVDLVHPDLQANMLPGYDATGQGSGGAPSGNDAHGTACAGIVAAVGDNNEGIAGVAYSCGIVPVRIAYSSGNNWITYNSWIANSINWSWQTAGADVLSNSWGGGGSSSAINGAIDGAVNNGRGGLGAPVLFAAGNDNSSVSYPATCSPTIAVIAMSMCDQRKSPSSCDNETWWGSNFGANADVAAPGVKIYATDISGSNGYSGGNYVSNFNGTSSACPNAAGVMALILSVNGNLTEDQAREALETTCDKVGGYSYSPGVSGQPNGSWSSELGYGRVNAEAALLAVAPSSPNDAGISAISSPQGTICSLSATPSVTLRNYGSNTLTSATIHYQVDSGPVSTLSWSGSLPSLGTTNVTLPNISFSSGSHTFTAYTSSPNGQSDSNPNNDSSSSSFLAGSNGVTLTIILDNYPGETTWEIRDASNNLIASGGP